LPWLVSWEKTPQYLFAHVHHIVLVTVLHMCRKRIWPKVHVHQEIRPIILNLIRQQEIVGFMAVAFHASGNDSWCVAGSLQSWRGVPLSPMQQSTKPGQPKTSAARLQVLSNRDDWGQSRTFPPAPVIWRAAGEDRGCAGRRGSTEVSNAKENAPQIR